jgi:thiamine-monophosphate kinase
VSGTIGDAGAGLALLSGGRTEPAGLIERYRNPRPRLEAGQRLAPLATAMMDVSDGLLIDATRMADASTCALTLELEAVPLSGALTGHAGSARDARLAAASAGDDYELLFATDAGDAAAILALADELGLPFSRIGRFSAGAGLTLTDDGTVLPLPDRLGFEHRR